MVFKVLRNPVYQVVMAMLLLAIGVVWSFDVAGLKTFALGFSNVGHVGLITVIMAMPAVVAPFPVNPELTSVAVAYKNNKLIADEVFPIVPVGLQNFSYKKYALADGFTIPDTKVGRTSAPGKVEFGFTEEPSSCVAYGLDEDVPQDDIDNAPAGYDPLGRAAMSVTDLVLLDRELRAATICFNAANYGAANKVALAGNDQFSDYANSDPIRALLTYLDSMIMRANKIFMGQVVWTILRQHPKVVSSILGNSGTAGVVTKEQLAEKLEIEKISVGSGWYNSAKKGQAPVMARLWGKSIAMHYQDAMADTRGRVTYGLTAQWGSRIAGNIPDPKIGLKGGQSVRSGMYVKELVTADDLGYLISTAVA